MTAPKQEIGPRSFSVYLTQMEEGRLHEEASEQTQTLVRELMTHVASFGGKVKGKLTLALDFVAEDNRLLVVGSVSVKSPKFPRQRTLFFADKNNNLSKEDPKQVKLPLAAVPGTPGLAAINDEQKGVANV